MLIIQDLNTVQARVQVSDIHVGPGYKSNSTHHINDNAQHEKKSSLFTDGS